jgi:hypothetical protein
MNKTLIIPLILLVMIGCNPAKEDIKEIDFNIFQLTTPSNWEKFTQKGIDAYVGGIKTAQGDTISFMIGTDIEGLSDYPLLQPYEIKLKLDSLGESYPPSMIFSKNYLLDRDQSIFLREYYYYDTLNSLLVKYQIPKKIGHGDFNAYFENIDSYGNDLIIGGHNLDSTLHRQFFESIQTIRFKKKN